MIVGAPATGWAQRPQPEAPQQLPRLELREDDGASKARDRGFKAIIRDDGSVRFAPAPRVQNPSMRFLGFELIRGSRPREDVGAAIEGDQAARRDESTQSAYGAVPQLIRLGTSFGGLADLLDRKTRHQYHKRQFLSQTEPIRRRMAIGFQRERMREELTRLGDLLLEIWRDETLSLARRRELIFSVWDDMLDPPAAAPGADATQKTGSEDVGDVGADGGDDEALAEQVRALERERRALAGEARRRVEEFIRRNAPRGDARGYTDEELARLNARRLSRAPFHPYGP